jgi:pilus assembly protein CpaF
MERTQMNLANSAPNWLPQFLLRQDLTDICISGDGKILIDRGAGMETCPIADRWDDFTLKQWTLDELTRAGRSWDARHPFIDAILPSGHRLHAVFPPISTHVELSIRRLPKKENGQAGRWSDSPMFSLLKHAIQAGESILLCGSTGSGKTTLANDLLSEVSTNERIIAVEDIKELAPRHPNFISMTSRPANADGAGEVTLRTILRESLRMRPDRIVVGECRGGEVLELLQALNTGHKGALATLHANSPRDALKRIELLCLIASGGSIPLTAIRELLASGIRWIGHVERKADAGRRITGLCSVEGREGDTILLRPVVQMNS